MSIKPITPFDVSIQEKTVIPDEVIAAFNELIAENWKKDKAVVKQKKAIARVIKKLPKFKGKADELFDLGYFDIEQIFRKAGWIVKYESPDRNESFPEYFVFSRKAL
jgi:hypothetical protein